MFGGIGIVKTNGNISDYSQSSLYGIASSLLNQVAGAIASKIPVTIMIIDDTEGTELEIPVNPQSIKLSWQRKTSTVDIIRLGEVGFTVGTGLESITFDSFFPREYVPTYCKYANIVSPRKAHNMMCNWKARSNWYESDPIRLIVTGALGITMPVTIDSYSAEERGGEPGDIYYSVTFKKWRSVNIRTLSEAEQEAISQREDSMKKPSFIDVALGDDYNAEEELFKASKMYYQDSSNYGSIISANAKTIANAHGTTRLVLP